MKDVFYSPNATSQDLLSTLESNIKEVIKPLDALFAVLVDMGIELSVNIEEDKSLGNFVYVVGDEKENPKLVACFDKNITLDTVHKLVAKQPQTLVFWEACFGSDSDKLNTYEIIKNSNLGINIKCI